MAVSVVPSTTAIPSPSAATAPSSAPAIAAPPSADPAPTPPVSPVQGIIDEMQGANSMRHAKALSKMPRSAGSENYLKAAQYVVDQATAAGWDARIEESKGSSWWGGSRKVYNVVAERKGTATEAERKLVVGGAHLDSVKRGPGANDNASGSAMLLETARVLGQVDTRHDVRLVWFDAEELGLVGSGAYVKDHKAELQERGLVMLNTDMVASPKGSIGFHLGPRAPKALGDAISGAATAAGLKLEMYPERTGRSDHAAFGKIGMPAAHYGVSVKRLGKEDPNYHSPNDKFEHLNPDVIEKFGDAYAVSLHHFATMSNKDSLGLLAAWQAKNGADDLA